MLVQKKKCEKKTDVLSRHTHICVPGVRMCVCARGAHVLLSDEHACAHMCLRVHICVFHVYTYVCSRVHLCVFHVYTFGTHVRSNWTRVCVPGEHMFVNR